MKPLIKKILIVVIISLAFYHCSSQQQDNFKPKEVYKSDALIIIQLAENAFQHISFKQTHDFGNVPCNGMIVRNSNETIVFDTPTNEKNSEELIKWIKDSLHCRINAIIPTHFHDDCLGGLYAFDKNNIPSYAHFKTIALAQQNKLAVPKNGFSDSLILKVGDETIIAQYFGEGHTKDNIVGYYSNENILFGGCLIKELNASKGYLEDANTTAWSGTVEKIKKQYPNIKIVVPGHGEYGNKSLLDYTINLFRTQ